MGGFRGMGGAMSVMALAAAATSVMSQLSSAKDAKARLALPGIKPDEAYQARMQARSGKRGAGLTGGGAVIGGVIGTAIAPGIGTAIGAGIGSGIGYGAEMFMGPELFALRVTGDSMIDAGILDEDYVIIRKQPVARDGDIVVAMIDKSEATLKRFKRKSEDQIALIPENSEMEPMIYPAERVSIHGVLVGQLRNYR